MCEIKTGNVPNVVRLNKYLKSLSITLEVDCVDFKDDVHFVCIRSESDLIALRDRLMCHLGWLKDIYKVWKSSVCCIDNHPAYIVAFVSNTYDTLFFVLHSIKSSVFVQYDTAVLHPAHVAFHFIMQAANFDTPKSVSEASFIATYLGLSLRDYEQLLRYYGNDMLEALDYLSDSDVWHDCCKYHPVDEFGKALECQNPITLLNSVRSSINLDSIYNLDFIKWCAANAPDDVWKPAYKILYDELFAAYVNQ